MMNLVMRLRAALNARVLVMLVLMLAVASGLAQQQGNPAVISQQQFTDLATQILTYLGYAIVAGLTVLVAVIGARRAWGFMRRFL
jgi:di/tricarboxylate transporter